MRTTLILGTRGSALALSQSLIVKCLLETEHPRLTIEQKIISTTGDARPNLALHEPTAEGAGLFTKQLEDALLRGEIDFAVHSLKDLPVESPAGLVLAAILPRAPIADLLISRYPGGVEGLPQAALIGTSSPRRALLLQSRYQAMRPDLRIESIRGNVPTRLQKVADGDSYDATILAEAGLLRLGHDLTRGELVLDGIKLYIDPFPWMLPAPGQGAIAIETRCDSLAVDFLAALHDSVTARCVEAERLVLKHLGGGCHLALGALATENKQGIALQAVFIPDVKSQPRRASAIAPDSTTAARLVADRLLAQ